jgi:hypothetical protein
MRYKSQKAHLSYSSYVQDLQELLRLRGLKLSGRKEDLVARIVSAGSWFKKIRAAAL